MTGFLYVYGNLRTISDALSGDIPGFLNFLVYLLVQLGLKSRPGAKTPSGL